MTSKCNVVEHQIQIRHTETGSWVAAVCSSSRCLEWPDSHPLCTVVTDIVSPAAISALPLPLPIPLQSQSLRTQMAPTLSFVPSHMSPPSIPQRIDTSTLLPSPPANRSLHSGSMSPCMSYFHRTLALSTHPRTRNRWAALLLPAPRIAPHSCSGPSDTPALNSPAPSIPHSIDMRSCSSRCTILVRCSSPCPAPPSILGMKTADMHSRKTEMGTHRRLRCTFPHSDRPDTAMCTPAAHIPSRSCTLPSPPCSRMSRSDCYSPTASSDMSACRSCSRPSLPRTGIQSSSPANTSHVRCTMHTCTARSRPHSTATDTNTPCSAHCMFPRSDTLADTPPAPYTSRICCPYIPCCNCIVVSLISLCTSRSVHYIRPTCPCSSPPRSLFLTSPLDIRTDILTLHCTTRAPDSSHSSHCTRRT